MAIHQAVWHLTGEWWPSRLVATAHEGHSFYYRRLFYKFDWYEVANFVRRDKIFCDVFSIYHELSAHNAEQAFLIWVEHT